jgi:hypothetical protein
MTVARANTQFIDLLERIGTFSKGFVLEGVDKQQFAVRFTQQCTLFGNKNTINLGSEGEKTSKRICPIFSFS